MTSTTDSTPASAPSGAGADPIVVNRHIPSGWNNFIPPGKEGRKTSLCGRKVLAKYCGIPGITTQAVNYGDRAGWCEPCIRQMFFWYKNSYKKHPFIPEVRAVYDLVFWEMFRFIKYTVDNGGVDLMSIKGH